MVVALALGACTDEPSEKATTRRGGKRRGRGGAERRRRRRRRCGAGGAGEARRARVRSVAEQAPPERPAGAGAGGAGGSGQAAALPWLHVEGNQIKDPNGATVILRGVSLIDLGALEAWEGGIHRMIDRLTDPNDTQGSSPGWHTKVVRFAVVPSRRR